VQGRGHSIQQYYFNASLARQDWRNITTEFIKTQHTVTDK